MEFVAWCFIGLLWFPILYLIFRGTGGKQVKQGDLITEGYSQAYLDLRECIANARVEGKRKYIIALISRLEEENRKSKYMADHGKEPWKSGAQRSINANNRLIVEARSELRKL